MSKRGRGAPKRQETIDFPVLKTIRFAHGDNAKINAMAKRFGISASQFCREAIMDRVSLAQSTGRFPSTQARDPVDVETAQPKRSGNKPAEYVSMTEIKNNLVIEEAYYFLKRFIVVSKRHPRLKKRLKKNLQDEYCFDILTVRAIVECKHTTMWKDAGDSYILRALDNLGWYNGDDDRARWGVADINWLFKFKKSARLYGWQRLILGYVDRGTDLEELEEDENEERDKKIVGAIQPMAAFICEGMGYVEGSNDYTGVLEYLYQKGHTYGIEKLRDVVNKYGLGMDGWKNIRKAFREIEQSSTDTRA